MNNTVECIFCKESTSFEYVGEEDEFEVDCDNCGKNLKITPEFTVDFSVSGDCESENNGCVWEYFKVSEECIGYQCKNCEEDIFKGVDEEFEEIFNKLGDNGE